jgi:hypothetical protein
MKQSTYSDVHPLMNIPLIITSMKRILLASLLLVISGFYTTSSAQFEGEVNFLIYNPNETGEATNLDLTFTKNRIYIGSNSSMDVMTGLSANGILVRNDYQDFVFMTEKNEALKIAKSDIDALVNLINRVQGRSDSGEKPQFDWDSKVVETGNRQTIHGYEASEFVLRRDEENEHVSVWLTDAIKVDWGLLNEAWHTTGSKQVGEDIPIELVMNRNSFPLLVEAYRDGQPVFRAESVNISSRNFDRSRTEISSGTKLLGLGDLMMNMFRQRR